MKHNLMTVNTHTVDRGEGKNSFSQNLENVVEKMVV